MIGGTGTIGSRIANEATKRGHEVTIVTRSGDKPALKDTPSDKELARIYGMASLRNTQKANATDTKRLASLATGHDAVVMAMSPPRDGSDPVAPLLAAGRSIIEATRIASIKRLVIVGGAGSLLLPSGDRLVDSPNFPAMYKSEALAHAELLKLIRESGKDLDWTYISPAAEIAPGERSGNFTIGGDEIVTNAKGESRISAEDYAVVLIDEIEQGNSIQHRMTAAYT